MTFVGVLLIVMAALHLVAIFTYDENKPKAPSAFVIPLEIVFVVLFTWAATIVL